MKTSKITMFVLALATGLLFTLGSCNKENTLSSELNSNEGALKASGPSANGQGAFIWNDNMRHFTFHANTMPDGSVKGNGVLTYNGGAVNIKFDIDCMYLISDKTAQLSGVITSHSTDPNSVGAPCFFVVTDNGQGKNAPADQITFLYYYPGQTFVIDCTEDFGAVEEDFVSITSGNIQVKP